MEYGPYVFFDAEKGTERRNEELCKRPKPVMDIKDRGFHLHFLFYNIWFEAHSHGMGFSFVRKNKKIEYSKTLLDKIINL